jgi:predicted nucleic acid-binding protein
MTSVPSSSIVVVDASVWVSRLVSADVHHAASRRWLEDYVSQGGQVIAPMLLLPEIAGAISRRTGEPDLAHQAIKQLERLSALRLVAIDQRLGQAATQLAAECGLRGADATYVATAQQLKVPLLTWDNEQLDKVKTLIQVFTPDTLFKLAK